MGNKYFAFLHYLCGVSSALTFRVTQIMNRGHLAALFDPPTNLLTEQPLLLIIVDFILRA